MSRHVKDFADMMETIAGVVEQIAPLVAGVE